jgi:hypothetical protein
MCSGIASVKIVRGAWLAGTANKQQFLKKSFMKGVIAQDMNATILSRPTTTWK